MVTIEHAICRQELKSIGESLLHSGSLL